VALFRFGDPLHEIADGFATRFPFEEHGIDFPDDRHFDPVSQRQPGSCPARPHPFRHGLHPGENGVQCITLAESNAHVMITTQGTGARQHQITDA
jgi:hypothetical protein